MLNAKKLAFSGGIVWSIFCFLFVVFILITGSGLEFINSMLSSFIDGYRLNWTGAFVAIIGGFLDGFIFFYLLALIYNALSRKKENIKVEKPIENEF